MTQRLWRRFQLTDRGDLARLSSAICLPFFKRVATAALSKRRNAGHCEWLGAGHMVVCRRHSLMACRRLMVASISSALASKTALSTRGAPWGENMAEISSSDSPPACPSAIRANWSSTFGAKCRRVPAVLVAKSAPSFDKSTALRRARPCAEQFPKYPCIPLDLKLTSTFIMPSGNDFIKQERQV